MRQLTSHDTNFLAIEDGRRHGHACVACVLDPSSAPGGTLKLADLDRVFAERLRLLPPLRWRLAEVPLRLDYPYWWDDPDVDLTYHVRELSLPVPGDAAVLAEQVAQIASRPLDRARPLWQAYLVRGLEGGKIALLMKIHHALIDGVSGAEILARLFDTSPAGHRHPPTAWSAARERRPGSAELFARGIAGLPRQPLRALRALPSALSNIDSVPLLRAMPFAARASRLAAHARRAAANGRHGASPAAPGGQAPRTPFNARISAQRRVAFTSLSLDDIAAVQRAFAATVNDVLVAVCTTAVRDWLLARDALPDEPLLALVPVSERTHDQRGTFGNRVSVMIVPLVTDEPDPCRRMLRTRDVLRSAKARHGAVPADILARAHDLIPPALLASAARARARRASSGRCSPPYNFVISNVPGPRVPVYFAGARQLANYPAAAIVDGVGLNISALSYCDRLDVGLVAGRELILDLHRMAQSLQDALAELSGIPQLATR